MKYLLLIVIVLAVVWYVRNNRRADSPRDDKPAPKAPAGDPQDMVECPVCLVHLPRTDALPGPNGRLYCCADHRLRAGE